MITRKMFKFFLNFFIINLIVFTNCFASDNFQNWLKKVYLCDFFFILASHYLFCSLAAVSFLEKRVCAETLHCGKIGELEQQPSEPQK